MSDELKLKILQELSKGNVRIGQFIMEVHGDNHYHEKDNSEKRPKVTDEQVAQALLNINGKDQVLNNYQLWLGACCLLMWKYNFPRNLEMCCDRINSLPYHGKLLPLECKYDNIRKFSYLKFVKEDVDKWGDYQPQDDEKKLFYGWLCSSTRIR